MYTTGDKTVKGHAAQGLSVAEDPQRVRGRAGVRCDAFGVGVWGSAKFEQEREILTFACSTCGRGLVVDLMASKILPASRTTPVGPPRSS